jgi:Asp-tRNA(Asn)/Glu-tRNA(Gln) amidotransferase A subunit family amidase
VLAIRDISMPLQIRCLAAVVIMLANGSDSLADGTSPAPRHPQRQERSVAGWRLFVSQTLLDEHAAATERAIELLEKQLEEIVRVVPSDTVTKLKAVPLYFSVTYAGVDPKAEYHPAAGWLRKHGRDPTMEKAVEFTNVHIFEAETRRMPNFALHELAHAYHDRELADGFGNRDVADTFERARASGTYDRVERQDAEGRRTTDRAYALTNPQEYFAETTEAYFSRNDFFPFCREELEAHDPHACRMLEKLWQADAPRTPKGR